MYMSNNQMDESSLSESKTEKASSSPNSDQVSVLLNLENLVKSHVTGLDRRREELKKNKEMLEDILINDPTYQKHEEQTKEANKIKNSTKRELFKQPNAVVVVDKVKSLRAEIKQMESALSDYLREYGRMSGSNEIEGEDGEVKEIVYVAKLIKKSKNGK